MFQAPEIQAAITEDKEPSAGSIEAAKEAYLALSDDELRAFLEWQGKQASGGDQ
ncbi:hypothetical protein TVNIR_2100 [Thioalkalivibrio nitratireducens DSM 14787]|uniref:Uncharacterized protein n=1 Tax=Thioalkalivibrio nitratireducens (strain DSM 14787 / UNIQEM 213 / ALEN2) TaxID=1255043 RepID=L0DXR3_THIND|nr:hypothetical protein [Thioalkalivibrio nitratireducens]AGA33760.1 hypothetical protein TVNIR_2100 [Thioalkalivibrio nitratireducens DSM 14787]